MFPVVPMANFKPLPKPPQLRGAASPGSISGGTEGFRGGRLQRVLTVLTWLMVLLLTNYQDLILILPWWEGEESLCKINPG